MRAELQVFGDGAAFGDGRGGGEPAPQARGTEPPEDRRVGCGGTGLGPEHPQRTSRPAFEVAHIASVLLRIGLRLPAEGSTAREKARQLAATQRHQGAGWPGGEDVAALPFRAPWRPETGCHHHRPQPTNCRLPDDDPEQPSGHLVPEGKTWAGLPMALEWVGSQIRFNEWSTQMELQDAVEAAAGPREDPGDCGCTLPMPSCTFPRPRLSLLAR